MLISKAKASLYSLFALKSLKSFIRNSRKLGKNFILIKVNVP